MSKFNGIHTVVIGVAFRGPPGLGGDSFGLSNALDSQSFFTGGGTGVPTVAIDISPILCWIINVLVFLLYINSNSQIVYHAYR